MLLIDDVQFLASKAKTEEEFFHTFNAIYESGRQLVLTCDRLPRALVSVEERLRERFEAGLVADIGAPDLATRVAILRKRAMLDRVPLADDAVLGAIAERVTDNIRALEGALIRVVAYHSLTGQPIDLELTRTVLDAMYPRATARRASITEIQAAVASRYGLAVSDLLSSSRTARIVWPRQLAIYLSREFTGTSLQTIGEAFGGRNHATVLHACKRVWTASPTINSYVTNSASSRPPSATREPTAATDRLLRRCGRPIFPLAAAEPALIHSSYSPYDY